MENILEWGIEVVCWFQQFSPKLDLPFIIFTFLGEEIFFLLLLPLMYWCVDRHIGARLAIIFLFSAYLNAFAKMLASQPRPFLYDDRVLKLFHAEGGGFPSGHTQNAVVVWGYLANAFKKRWLWYTAGLLMIFIPLSRIYLGVHFPTDLLGGYLIGGVLLLLYIHLEPLASEWFKSKSMKFQLFLALIAPLILTIIFFTKDGVTASAVLFGIGPGFLLEHRFVGFKPDGVWWKRLLRFILGVSILFCIWLGLRIAFEDMEPALLYRFVRYSLIGLWCGLAPWIFVKTGLADTEQ